MTINVIVAVADNGVIGKDGKIPWRLSTDLERRKRMLRWDYDYEVMDQRFYDLEPSLEEHKARVVLTEEPQLSFCHSYDSYITNFIPLEWFRKALKSEEERKFLIIGGQQIYDEIFKTPELIHRVYLTRVHCNVEGDAFFEPFDWMMDDEDDESFDKGWFLISQQFIPKSDKDEYDSTFQVWENRS